MRIEHRRAHRRLAPVEVRLRLQERVQIVLRGLGVPLPDAAAENADPVVGRRAVGPGVAPEVPVAARVAAARARLAKPRMLRRRMVADPIEDHAQVALVRFLEQSIEGCEGAEPRLDVAVVADVVTELLERRRITGREPDRVDAEPFQIVEPRGDSGQIAQAVVVRVEKRRHEQLVDRPALPPRLRAHAIFLDALIVRECSNSHASAPQAARALHTHRMEDFL